MDKPDKNNLVGTTLDRKYAITKVIGEGGMGSVYHGQHVHLKRDCAIKVIRRSHASDPVALKRFKLEAEAASMLKHPNIIEIYDFGITEDDLPYIVMEFLPGESLDDLLERQKYMHYEQAISIFLPVCDALAHAHDKKVLHRDLKPANIMVIRQDDGEYLVKLVDFGIAKLMPGTGRPIDKMTQTGEVFGSPMYMSPEQCMGQALDARSDIYALGCVFYESLTGKLPFEGETLFSVIMQHVNDLPRSFSTISPDIAIPQALEEIVLKCMSKDKETRFNSVAAIRKEMARIYTSKQFKSMPASPVNPRAAQDDLSSTAKVVNMDEGTVKVPKSDLPADSRQATSPNEEIDFAPAEEEELEDYTPESKSEEDLLAEIEKQEEEYGENCKFLIHPLQDLGFLYEYEGDSHRALRAWQREAKLVKMHHGEDSLSYAYSLISLARVYRMEKLFDSAEKFHSQGIALKIKNIDPDCIEVCTDYLNFARILLDQNKLAETKEILEKAVLSIYRSSGEMHQDTAAVEKAVANYYYEMQDYKTAATHFERAMAIGKELHGDSAGVLRELWNYLGLCKECLGDSQTAIELYKEVIKINEANPSLFDEYCAEPYRNIASCSYLLQKLKDAEKAALEGIRIYEELMDQNIYTDAYYLGQTCDTLSMVYKDWGRFPEAEKLKKRAEKLMSS